MKEKFGKLIRENREKKNLSQEQLAEKCGVTDKCISNIELGKSDPKLSTVMKLCAILEVDAVVLSQFSHIQDNNDENI